MKRSSKRLFCSIELYKYPCKMDLNSVPEKDRQKMMEMIEAKQVMLAYIQAQQFMKLYSFIVEKCFDDCINDFTSTTLSSKEVKIVEVQDKCVQKCTEKLLKHTNRIGQRMAEKQMLPTQQQ